MYMGNGELPLRLCLNTNKLLLTRPPLKFAIMLKLSLTSVIAQFQVSLFDGLRRRQYLLRRSKESNLGEQPFERPVGELPDDESPGNRDGSEGNGGTPFTTTDTSDLECGSTDENDDDLDSDLYEKTAH